MMSAPENAALLAPVGQPQKSRYLSVIFGLAAYFLVSSVAHLAVDAFVQPPATASLVAVAQTAVRGPTVVGSRNMGQAGVRTAPPAVPRAVYQESVVSVGTKRSSVAVSASDVESAISSRTEPATAETAEFGIPEPQVSHSSNMQPAKVMGLLGVLMLIAAIPMKLREHYQNKSHQYEAMEASPKLAMMAVDGETTEVTIDQQRAAAKEMIKYFKKEKAAAVMSTPSGLGWLPDNELLNGTPGLATGKTPTSVFMVKVDGENKEEGESTFKKNTEFGYSRKDVILISLGIWAAGYGMYYGLQATGMEPGYAGNYVQATVVFLMLVGWLGSYLFRVANKDMTYVKQLNNYEEAVMRKRMEEMPQAELEEMMAELDAQGEEMLKKKAEAMLEAKDAKDSPPSSPPAP